MSFLEVLIIREDKNFNFSIHRNPTFSGVYTLFENFLPSTNKFGAIYTLAYICFRICSRWTELHTELLILKTIFLKYDYPEHFIRYKDNIHIVKETTLIVEKKAFVLVIKYLGSISLYKIGLS